MVLVVVGGFPGKHVGGADRIPYPHFPPKAPPESLRKLLFANLISASSSSPLGINFAPVLALEEAELKEHLVLCLQSLLAGFGIICSRDHQCIFRQPSNS